MASSGSSHPTNLPVYKFHNSSQPLPTSDQLSSAFTITTSTGKDIWKKPPAHSVFTAPILYQSLPLTSFKSARVTVSADWVYQYDQGGLILIIHSTTGARKIVKTGIEFYNGRANVNAVAVDRWADWGLVPLPEGEVEATVEMERKDGGLWISWIDGRGERTPFREITWVFEREDEAGDCWVGAYAAKPGTEGGSLEVRFEGLEVERV